MKSDSSAESLLRLASNGRIAKHCRDNSVTEEMAVYFSKLKELVPFMPKNKKLSKLEIIQYVIDYICDLQLALESHPASRNNPADNGAAGSPASPANGSGSSSPARQPLGVIATPNALPNTCATQEVTHLDKVATHLDDLSTRPVSC